MKTYIKPTFSIIEIESEGILAESSYNTTSFTGINNLNYGGQNTTEEVSDSYRTVIWAK
ncbi:MAG: hypothetical protein IJS20_09785 [Bacteroidales bacterium]|nr:hypothetical protein [Bacteroidales bacterium]